MFPSTHIIFYLSQRKQKPPRSWTAPPIQQNQTQLSSGRRTSSASGTTRQTATFQTSCPQKTARLMELGWSKMLETRYRAQQLPRQNPPPSAEVRRLRPKYRQTVAGDQSAAQTWLLCCCWWPWVSAWILKFWTSEPSTWKVGAKNARGDLQKWPWHFIDTGPLLACCFVAGYNQNPSLNVPRDRWKNTQQTWEICQNFPVKFPLCCIFSCLGSALLRGTLLHSKVFTVPGYTCRNLH